MARILRERDMITALIILVDSVVFDETNVIPADQSAHQMSFSLSVYVPADNDFNHSSPEERVHERRQ